MRNVFRQYPILAAVLLGLFIGAPASLLFSTDQRWIVIVLAVVISLVSVKLTQPARKHPVTPTADKTAVSKIIAPEDGVVPPLIKSMFLYNALHNISAHIYFNSDKAVEIIEQLANLIRKVSEISRHESTLLGEELKAIELYLHIEKSRLGDRFETEHHISAECFEINFPSMALLPLIEHCIHYGVEQNDGPMHITLSALRKADGLQIQIVDAINISPHYGAVEEQRQAILADLQRRLDDFYNSHIIIEREKQDEGEVITVHLPTQTM